MKYCSLVFLALTIFFSSCTNKAEVSRVGVGFNTTRKKLGLPLLDPAWKLTVHNRGEFMWIPYGHRDSLEFFSKDVETENSRIIHEENHFFGKKRYTTADGDFFEEVWISCDFNDTLGIKSWGCEFRGMGNESGTKITKEQADSIIKSWGLTYK